jgi:hypothetical protein
VTQQGTHKQKERLPAKQIMAQRMSDQRSKKRRVHVAYRASAPFCKTLTEQCYSYHRKMPFGLQALFVGVHRGSLRIALKLRVKLFSNFNWWIRIRLGDA